MPVKSYRPTTPTRRFQTVVSREDITKQTPEKSLVKGKRATGGRSLDVSVNGEPIAKVDSLRADSTFGMSNGIQGVWYEREVPFEAVGNGGYFWSSLAIGTDGVPVLSYYPQFIGGLKIARVPAAP